MVHFMTSILPVFHKIILPLDLLKLLSFIIGLPLPYSSAWRRRLDHATSNIPCASTHHRTGLANPNLFTQLKPQRSETGNTFQNFTKKIRANYCLNIKMKVNCDPSLDYWHQCFYMELLLFGSRVLDFFMEETLHKAKR